ncbi:MAG: TonB-dependent receptor [Taibaiella sp.]|nr:TonB-dependent receptor [Taibaiella sp.]
MPSSIRAFSSCMLLMSVLAATAQEQQSDTMSRSEKPRKLKEVTVSAHRSAVETAPGKTIINVQSLAGNAGKTILDVLRKTPGVSVDGMGNISITGRQGVLVMIDGRQTYLSGDDLREYLRGITAEEVAQVEVISQPPAQYDAEGNAGIINLKLRKWRKKGINGSVNLTGVKSVLENSHNTVLCNYLQGKTNWHTSLNYIHGRNLVWWQQDTKFLDDAGNMVATSSMRSVPVEEFDKYNLRIGADKIFGERNTAGFDITTAYYGNVMNTPINTTAELANGSRIVSVRHTNENSLRRNATANAYLKHTFSKRSVLNLNADYVLNTKRLYQYLSTEVDSNAMPVAGLELRSKVPVDIAIYSLKADHTYNISEGVKLESGLKHSYVSVDNDAQYRVKTNGSWQQDPTRTNRFLYREHISAAYASGNMKFGEKWNGQCGVRAELADIQGEQQDTGESFHRVLPALFPTAYLSYKADSNNSFEVNYGRRIRRPQYGQLNPFSYYTFYNTYQKGNPNLLPQYAHNIELKHIYKHRLTTELSASRTTNALNYVTVGDNASQTTYGMPVNFSGSINASLGVGYNGGLTPWCELNAHATALYALYKGLVKQKEVHNEGVGYRVEAGSRVLLGEWGIDCYGVYTSRMANSPVDDAMETVYINMGVSRKGLLHDTTTVRLSIDDPLWLNRMGYRGAQPGLETSSTFIPNSRYCTMSVTYAFARGSESKPARREQQLEEARRM